MRLPCSSLLLLAIVPAVAFAQLRVSATDETGQPVLNLVSSDFRVLVDSREQPVRSVALQRTPISVGLVVDNGARMRDLSSLARKASEAIAAGLDSRDEAFVLAYNQALYLDRGFTNDPRELEKALDKTESRSSSRTLDALDAALDYAGKNARNPRKVLFLITAGEDGSSSLKADDLLSKAQNERLAIYPIGLLQGRSPEERRSVRRELTRIAEGSGGQALFLTGSTDFPEISRIVSELSDQYVIDCTPAKGRLKVVIGFPGLTVRVLQSN